MFQNIKHMEPVFTWGRTEYPNLPPQILQHVELIMIFRVTKYVPFLMYQTVIFALNHTAKKRKKNTLN